MTKSKFYALLTATGVTILGGGVALIVGHSSEVAEAIDAGYLTPAALPDGGTEYHYIEGPTQPE